MATSAGASNSAFTVAPGQAFLGQKATTETQVFGGRVTAAGGFAVGGGTPTVTIASGAGTIGSISQVTGYDQAASFRMVAGTATINGGTLATVAFGLPFDVAPLAVIVNAVNGAGTVGLAVGATGLTTTGFAITGGVPASGGTYSVNWFAVRSPL